MNMKYRASIGIVYYIMHACLQFDLVCIPPRRAPAERRQDGEASRGLCSRPWAPACGYIGIRAALHSYTIVCSRSQQLGIKVSQL
jgi:hypothetical protein